jgi:NADH:ubiquinone oxidoreductase subunit 5 (subunit L)/multisubunit Na+/H+ antiporter MnhA subunit
MATVILGASLVSAAVLCGVVFARGTVHATLGPLVLTADAVAVVLSCLVLVLSGVIQVFAVRYLRGDPRQPWWAVVSNLLTGCTAVLVCAGTVGVFTVSWICAGGCLVLLLAMYPRAPRAREGVIRTAISFAVGDLGLLAACCILILRSGHDVRLDALGSALATAPVWLRTAIGLLLVAAVLSRSSQIPFHRWLPSTLSAPTPVSALMHAGVVNAGAILVIRFAPVIANQLVVMLVLFIAGVATLLYASAVRLVKPDVKGRLVFSTMAQMGYMIMGCGLGAFAGVLLHLVAHSLFKSSLFLGAGRGIRQRAEARDWPRESPRRTRVVVASVILAVIIPSGAFAWAVVTVDPTLSVRNLPLFVFVLVSLGVAVARWLRSTWSAVAVAASVALAFLYTALLAWFASFVPVPAGVPAVPPLLVAIPIVALVVLEVLVVRRNGRNRFGARVYARALATSLPRPIIRKGANS